MNMQATERAVRFCCDGEPLVGIISMPVAGNATRGVVIVVGGPQYRVGSHRQFTLLARHLAERGIPVLRFDVRGMGDSGGERHPFDAMHADLQAAIDTFIQEVPSLTEVVLWGLCDGASAAILHAHRDKRIAGIVAVNPWVRTEQGLAQAYLRHYYAKRLLDPALWKKIARGRFDVFASVRSLAIQCWRILPGRSKAVPAPQKAGIAAGPCLALPDQLLEGLERFDGKVLCILSGRDLTAQEFEQVADSSRRWQGLMQSARVRRLKLADANHTFARQAWRDQVAEWTCDWVQSL